MISCVNIGGNDKVHAAVSIMGRESINKQCWECANCNEPTAGWDGSKFRCAFLSKDFGTWHYDVPNECPCKGIGWIPKKKEEAQMSNTNETRADIVAEMRSGTIPKHQTDHELLALYADRFEAACKREAEIAYLKGRMDEITDAVTKLETWRGALWSLLFKLTKLHDEMQKGEVK